MSKKLHHLLFGQIKPEEGYSADIYPWRYMSAQCPHYVRTPSHEEYMSAQYRQNVRTR